MTDTHYQRFEEKIGYVFKNKVLLQQALIHPSLSKIKVTKTKGIHSFERLEFLGDRVLGLVIATWLYQQYPDEPEGKLSRRYSHLVGRKTLQLMAEKIELQKFLLFDQDIRQKHHTILSDACEALIGSFFLDGGLKASESFILETWEPVLTDETVSFVDPKSALQEWAQQQHKALPIYETLEIRGPDHNPQFKVSVHVGEFHLCYGTGTSKREAEKQAAQNFLDALKISTSSP